MADLSKIIYSGDGKTLERFFPESEETVFAVSETVEHIAEEAFIYCKNLKKVILPQKIKVIPAGCFEECENLEEVVLPNPLELIEKFAFGDCVNLEEINSRPRPFLWQDAFRNCNKIIIDRDKMIWTGYFPIRECYCFMCEEKLEKVKFLDMPQVDGSFKKVNCVHWYCRNCQTHIFKNFQLERLLKIRKENIYG